jgi:hypothetical protein
MKKPAVINSFRFYNRKFLVTLDTSGNGENESMELCEKVTIREKPLKHLLHSDGILQKTEPLVFALFNKDDRSVEISMHYEGLPLEPMMRFIESIRRQWKKGP